MRKKLRNQLAAMAAMVYFERSAIPDRAENVDLDLAADIAKNVIKDAENQFENSLLRAVVRGRGNVRIDIDFEMLIRKAHNDRGSAP